MALPDLQPIPLRRLLVVHNRTSDTSERGIIRRSIAPAQGAVELVHVNPLRDSERNWRRKTEQKFSGAIKLGSGELDRTAPSDLSRQHDVRMFPLYDAHTAEGLEQLLICYSDQTAAEYRGGRVVRDLSRREAEVAELHLTDAGRAHPYFHGYESPIRIPGVHNDSVGDLPPGAVRLGYTDRDENSVWALDGLLASQLHPELLPAYLNRSVQRTNVRRAQLGLEPYRLTSSSGRFDESDNTRGLIVNFVNSLPTVGEIFRPVQIRNTSQSSNL